MNKVKKHFDTIAATYDYYKKKNWYYYKNLKKLLKFYIPKNSKVMEFGCGTGDLIISLKPSVGYGIDVSDEMIKLARDKYNKNKNVKFSTSYSMEKFDYVFMSDVIEHLEKPAREMAIIYKNIKKNGLFICTMANPFWEPLLMVAEKIGLKMPEGPHKRISFKQIERIMNKQGLKIIRHDFKLLMPIYFPWVTRQINRRLEKYFKQYAFIEYIIAKKI